MKPRGENIKGLAFEGEEFPEQDDAKEEEESTDKLLMHGLAGDGCVQDEEAGGHSDQEHRDLFTEVLEFEKHWVSFCSAVLPCPVYRHRGGMSIVFLKNL